jgi:indolepyruvate ferredoxin oxidoreductase
MGGEGVPWVGQAPFTNEPHIFSNLGDGTYFHSGLLAIRQSIAAGVNITYKVLYNDAVAMTGGQRVGERAEGHSVLQIQKSLTAEGVAKLVIVSDEPEKYNGIALESGVTVHHRDEMEALQKQFREIKGTTAIIYDQTCATEKRRRRKRGLMVDPAQRVEINAAVCEGCGDCSSQSNCMSVEPLETPLGRKRQINQSTCNKDFSCVKGFCPSFVTVHGTPKKRSKGTDGRASPFDDALFGSALPMPTVPKALGAYGIVVAGVGGTGVITIGQLLGVAAHLEGKGIVTQDAAGLAQKGGNTWSHVQISDNGQGGVGDIRCTRVSAADADLIIGCDPLVAASKETAARMRMGKTRVALNSSASPSASFVGKSTSWSNPAGQCVDAVIGLVGKDAVGQCSADAAAVKLLGDSLYSNPMMLGYAWQMGWIPLQLESLMRAIELNDVAIDNNKAAFTWGRRAAVNWAAVEKLLTPAQAIQITKRETLEDILAPRSEFLTQYQDAAYAQTYSAFVAQVKAAEERVMPGKTLLTEAVARYLFKLMAFKDEYEVARLHTDSAFHAKLAAAYEPGYKLEYHLAPPLLAKSNEKGELVKKRYGQWMLSAFGMLAKLKGLRGGALDIFGKTAERQMERALIAEYRASIEKLLPKLSAANHAQAVDLARIPEQIKGFGHVKERNVKLAREKWKALEAAI